MKKRNRGAAIGLALLAGGWAIGNVCADVVWRVSPTNGNATGVTDTWSNTVPPNVVGVRVTSGTIQFQSGNTYTGGTELQGGTHQIYANSPFGSTSGGAVSLQGGLMQCGGS